MNDPEEEETGEEDYTGYGEYGSEEWNSDDEEEYELCGGDNSLYDSITDDIDELKTIKQTLEVIY